MNTEDTADLPWADILMADPAFLPTVNVLPCRLRKASPKKQRNKH